MPESTRDDDIGDVYVMKMHLRDRPYRLEPRVGAERKDTDFFFEIGVYDDYPAKKLAYIKRRQAEERKTRKWQEWGWKAISALDDGEMPLPDVGRRTVMPIVFRAVYYAGAHGVTRHEICRKMSRDGGKVSGAMHDLHAAGIIFPLEGVRR